MYSIYGDGVCIYTDVSLLDDRKVLNPKLQLTDNAAGSLDITIPPGNIGYDLLKRMKSEIVVYRDNNELWSGRIIAERDDFWNQRVLTCEGELAYLNDTTQPPEEYNEITIRDFLITVLNIHNTHVEDSKKFDGVGEVTFDGSITLSAITNYETTLETIRVNLIEKFGGHIYITKTPDGKRRLNYIQDYVNTNSQEIRFGKNLLDFVKDYDMTNLATVIIPRGAQNENTGEYLTVKEATDGDGTIYVKADQEVLDEFGWIEKVVDFEDITDPNELLTKAREYLADRQFEDMVIEISAIDLHYYTRDVEAIKILDLVRCISTPHGMEHNFPVSQLTIPLDSPEKATYTLGTKVRASLTSSNNKKTSSLEKKMESIPSTANILKAARENANEIMNMATNGYITITKGNNGSEALIISDTIGYEDASRYWKWNVNGLAYYNKGSLKMAMTMDGAIVADFITAGEMSANRVTTGKLEAKNKNVIFDLDNGKLTIKSGEISLGTKDSTNYTPFYVNDAGWLHCVSGEIGGFTITTNSLYSNYWTLLNDGLHMRDPDESNLSSYLGKIGTNYWAHAASKQVLSMDINYGTQGIWWGAQMGSSDTSYEVKLAYVAEKITIPTQQLDYNGNKVSLICEKNTLNAFCNMDFHNYTVSNFLIDTTSVFGFTNGYTTNNIYIRSWTAQNTYTGYFTGHIENGLIRITGWTRA